MSSTKEFLHGTLNASIFQAKNLLGLRSFHRVLAKVENAVCICDKSHNHNGIYATIEIGAAKIAETTLSTHHPSNPVWNNTFNSLCAYSGSYMVISVKEKLPVTSQILARARIPVSDVLEGNILQGWLPLYEDDGCSKKIHRARIHVMLQFNKADKDLYWGAGIRNPDFPGVENVFFKQNKGCKVKLYQNTYLTAEYKPEIQLGHGDAKSMYKPERLWEDVYEYIQGAKHFIYIAGWSVNVNVELVRDQERMIPGARGVTLGELLKRKANEGVNVLVLIWEDRTALKILGNAGLMDTHCQETFEYFKETMVKCVLCPRNPGDAMSPVDGVEIALEFTHHQKSICVDALHGSAEIHESSKAGEVRSVVSFVGGVDLCGGRYDDERHSIFRTLNTVNKDDFLQNNFKDANLEHGGPREPWHDLHSIIRGPSAYDVLDNFCARWLKQADRAQVLLLPRQVPGLLQRNEPAILDNSSSSWNVQIFRSIDNASVNNFPTSPNQVARSGLSINSNQVVDNSIQRAYVEAIRRAKHYIYIENQYFFGGCSSWDRDQDCGCLHIVPTEIALKIVSKIKARERFAVYIITPMWPEGIPEGDSVQSILHWFRNTVRMMYSMIGKALAEENMLGQFSPTDYLNFFCLGNREIKLPGEYEPPEKPEQGSDYWNAQIHRRFMIYVHAKCMIVDDEYVLVGSANLNQRSMDGGRDTEIVQGCYQPQEINKGDQRARGEVFGYRMSLWYEHFAAKNGGILEEYFYPESLECVKTIQKITQNTWNLYSQEEVVEDLPGHLLPFPMTVLPDGTLADEEDRFFPDTRASTEGHKGKLPSILTT